MTKLRLYCFSPPVMLATFLFEIGAMLYVIVRGRGTRSTVLIATILGCLGFFQLAEWMVCEQALGLDSLTWAKLGYVAISFLPALGLHLAYRLLGQKGTFRWLIMLGYALAAAFSAYFLFATQSISASQCLGNYALFVTPGPLMQFYGLYYYAWLLCAVGWLLFGRTKVKQLWRRQATVWLAVGNLAFLVPVTVVNLVSPETILGIPSIMCGFAVLLAVVLVFKVFPLVQKYEK